MTQRKARLGDVIDDHCPRCKLLMNHGVVGMVEGTIKKVRCLTCYFEHPYRGGRSGRSKSRKQRERNKLVDQVLGGRDRDAPAPENQPKAPVTGRLVRIARPEEPHENPSRTRETDPPAETLPPPTKGKGKVASWRKAWEKSQKKEEE